MDDDSDRCVYCACPVESHDITGCADCACGMSLLWHDERGPDID